MKITLTLCVLLALWKTVASFTLYCIKKMHTAREFLQRSAISAHFMLLIYNSWSYKTKIYKLLDPIKPSYNYKAEHFMVQSVSLHSKLTNLYNILSDENRLDPDKDNWTSVRHNLRSNPLGQSWYWRGSVFDIHTTLNVRTEGNIYLLMLRHFFCRITAYLNTYNHNCYRFQEL